MRKMKKMKWTGLLLLSVVLVLSSSVPAANTYWNGGAGNWNVTGNWSAGMPSGSNFAVIDVAGSVATISNPTGTIGNMSIGDTTTMNELEVVGGGSITTGYIMFGVMSGGGGKLTVSGGSMSSTTLFNGVNGTGDIEVNSGTLSATLFRASWGATSVGHLQMNGGAFTVQGNMVTNGASADSVATMDIHGGTLTVTGTLTWHPGGGTGSANMDIIPGGTFVVAGDQTGASWIDLITYSISAGDGTGVKSAIYDGSAWTTITSTPEPATLALLGFGGLLGLLRRRRRA